jgi:hypothetical protein
MKAHPDSWPHRTRGVRQAAHSEPLNMRFHRYSPFQMFAHRTRIWLFAISIVIFLTSGALGQEGLIHRPPDTTFTLRDNGRFGPPFFMPPTPFLLAPAKSELEFSDFLRQSLFQADRKSQQLDQNFMTLQCLWQDEVVRGNQYQTLTEIVGAVEAGAVTYLAFRHLKRYGLK